MRSLCERMKVSLSFPLHPGEHRTGTSPSTFQCITKINDSTTSSPLSRYYRIEALIMQKASLEDMLLGSFMVGIKG